jgi:hypothetical protein
MNTIKNPELNINKVKVDTSVINLLKENGFDNADTYKEVIKWFKVKHNITIELLIDKYRCFTYIYIQNGVATNADTFYDEREDCLQDMVINMIELIK